MSSSLAVKYRPTNWSDVCEQGSTKIILQNQLNTGEIKNAYLFTGPAGCGKTTCARIFANEINKHCGSPIELDAASNNSVDDVREIIQQAKTASLDSEYKVFIMDECFSGCTLIKTVGGDKRIDEITTNDVVYTMGGVSNVSHVFKNSVLTSRLCCVTINNKNIFTTLDHLFFTDNGWVAAKDLVKGDIVYDTQSLRELWKRVFGTEQPQICKVLLSSMFSGVQEENAHSEDKDSLLYYLQEADGNSELLKKENLFPGLHGETNFKVRKSICEYRIWNGVTETSIRKNVQEQPVKKSGNLTKNNSDKREKRNATSVDWREGWQWEVHNSTDSLVASIRKWMGVGVCDTDTMPAGNASVSYVLQSRPWLSQNETCSRGGWQFTQLERWTCEGCKENRVSEPFRVDRVEVYKRGYNDELFQRGFTDTELSSGIVQLYDLEVAGTHNYFANDVLVHNCHSLSNSAWQAMLKVLEEPPAKSIFIMCTTNPEKIPRTILSRVQRYDFQRISQKSITDRLLYIMSEENEEDNGERGVSAEALEYIAKLSNGGMRDAITMLDKCLAYSDDLTMENVGKALGISSYDTLMGLLGACYENNLSTQLTIINEVYLSGKDLKQFIKDFTMFVLDCCKYNLNAGNYLNCPSTKEIIMLFKKCGDMTDLLSSLVRLQADIKWDTNPKARIEAWCIVKE